MGVADPTDPTDSRGVADPMQRLVPTLVEASAVRVKGERVAVELAGLGEYWA